MRSRERVLTALRHEEPDRVPVDFLATPDVWDKLVAHVAADTSSVGATDFIQREREALLRHFEVDTRVLSYDMFCRPPDESNVEWWNALDRSTPNRMWRRRNEDGTTFDIWGCHRQKVEHGFGAYEEFASWPLQSVTSVDELAAHPWPEPDWWDFSPLPAVIEELDEYHLRFRIGSVFEIGWQLRGMQEFLIDLAINPEIPAYIMGRLTDVYVENLRRVLDLAGDRLDMVYFYDDVATQNSLMISPETWRELVRPHHARLTELAHSRGVPVMYHCDGAIYPLIPELIDLGVDLLNPIQPDAKGMEAQRLKDEFGDQLSFHGGVDILRILPQGTVDEVRDEVVRLVDTLGRGGGFILCSSHHLQPDTPLENILAMYDVSLRYRR
jgi:uroporphyrinogen decarboxylase